MEFIRDNIWLFGVLLFSGGALLWPHLQTRGRKVSLLQATQMINQGKTVIVDVRQPSEFAAGHLRGAINLPLKDVPQRVGELEKSKNKNIIVVCQTGMQSGKAAAQFEKAGFKEVYSLEGGVAAWQAQGLPVAK
jgi:rhodanese-related sulfurtransferase